MTAIPHTPSSNSSILQMTEAGTLTVAGTPTNESGPNVTYVVQDTSAVAVLVPVVFGLIFLVGMCGNCLVIAAMVTTRRNHPRGLRITDRFILNLAVSDLFFLVFCVPFQAPVYSMDGWPFGRFMCVFCEVCQEVTMLASIYTLAALSFDRFLAVVYATSAKQWRTKRNASMGMVAIWIIAFGLGLPSLMSKTWLEYEGKMLCVTKWFGWYHLAIFVMGYLAPLTVIVICYLQVLKAMCKTARRSARRRSLATKNTKRRVTKIVVTLVIVFALDWLPHHVAMLWLKFGAFPFTRATFCLRVSAHCLSYANSCFNPVIYAFVSSDFRRDFRKAFTCAHLAGGFRQWSMRYVHSHTSFLRRSNRGDGRNGDRKLALEPRPPTISNSSYARSRSDAHLGGLNPMTDYKLYEVTTKVDSRLTPPPARSRLAS